VIILTFDHAPLLGANMLFDGMIDDDGVCKPGAVLRAVLELRKRVGIIDKKKKPGMRFETRSSEDLIDAMRGPCNELGLLIYPTECKGNGFPVEDGTLASVGLDVVVQSVEDGSAIKWAGFGLGADTQDKAGGKAGTYAFKAACLQGLLAAGAEDTDDTDTPIQGGVRAKPLTPVKPVVTRETVKWAFEQAMDPLDYAKAKAMLSQLSKDDVVDVFPTAKLAKERTGA
jgi:ERF superfamily